MPLFTSDRFPAGLCSLESRWYTVDGNRMHARAAPGPFTPDAVPIILVHGLGVSGRYMIPVAGQLGAYHPTYIPYLPGFGSSSKPRHACSLAGLADALAAWMDAAELDKAVLLGNSFGCQIIVETAVRHPDRTTAVILQAPTMDINARSTPGQAWRFIRNSYREPFGLMPVVVSDYLRAGLGRTLATFRTALNDPLERKVAGIKVPALVIRGENDPIAPEDWTRKLSRLFPRARHVVLSGVAHTAVFSAPEPLAFAVRQFISGRILPERINARKSPPAGLANFDSSSAMLRAASRVLHGWDFPALGLPSSLQPLMKGANHLQSAYPPKTETSSGSGKK